MATVAAVQAVVDPTGNNMNAYIIRSFTRTTFTDFLVIGMCVAPGRTMWVECTTAQTAAQQGAAILAALVA